MNSLIQNSLVFIAVALAVVFLIKKYFLKKKNSKKACGNGSNCGCN